MGVDAAGNKDEGAGDQGIMFGYACRETEELMPAPIYLQRTTSCARLAEARHDGRRAQAGLGPDAKSQVTLEYEQRQAGARRPRSWSRPSTARTSTRTKVREIVRPHVVNVLPEGWMCDEHRTSTSTRPAAS